MPPSSPQFDESEGSHEAIKGGHSNYPPLVLVHGLGGLFNSWQNNAPALSKVISTIIIELPDYKETETGYSVNDYKDYIIKRLDSLRICRAIIAGHSSGGQIAALIASQVPSRVAGLILIGSSGLQESTRPLRTSLRGRPTKQIAGEILKGIFHDPSSFFNDLNGRAYAHYQDRKRLRGLIRTAKKIQRYRLNSILPKIQVPTLLIWGKDDKITPPKNAVEFKSLISHATLQFLDNCGHAPQIEHPELFNRLVIEFCKSLFPYLRPDGNAET